MQKLANFLSINFNIEGNVYIDKLESSAYTKDASHEDYEFVISFEKINSIDNVTIVAKTNDTFFEIGAHLRKKLYFKMNLTNFANNNFDELYHLIDLAPQEAIAYILRKGYLDDKSN